MTLNVRLTDPICSYLDRVIDGREDLKKLFYNIASRMNPVQSDTRYLELVRNTQNYPYPVQQLIRDLNQIHTNPDKDVALREIEGKIGSNYSKRRLLYDLVTYPCSKKPPKISEKIQLIALENAIVSLAKQGFHTYKGVHWNSEEWPEFECEREIEGLVTKAFEEEFPRSLIRSVTAAAAGAVVFGGIAPPLLLGALTYKVYPVIRSLGRSPPSKRPPSPMPVELAPQTDGFRSRTRRVRRF